MKMKLVSKVNVFILELTIVILTFALAGAIAVSLFANAHNVGQRASDITIAMMKTQSLAESFKSQASFIDFTDLSGIRTWPLYFDKDWQAIPTFQSSTVPENASFSIEATVSTQKTDAGMMATVAYAVQKSGTDDSPMYTLMIKKYFSDRGVVN